jgi:hypothetical protein
MFTYYTIVAVLEIFFNPPWEEKENPNYDNFKILSATDSETGMTDKRFPRLTSANSSELKVCLRVSKLIIAENCSTNSTLTVYHRGE